MASIDIQISNQKYVVRGDEADANLDQIARLVQSKINSLQQEHPNLTSTKVALLAAIEFASQSLQERHHFEGFREQVLSKAGEILDRIERELTPSTN